MAISVVQSVGNAATANVSSLGVTITPTAGNNLIAAVAARNGATGVTGPTGWTKATEIIASNFAASIWYLENYSGSGAQTYTWTMAASDSLEAIIVEVTGLATSGSLDVVASNDSATAVNPVDSGTTATTATANEFWFAAMGSSGSGNRTISGLTAGWTQDTTENSSVATHPTHLTDCYQIATATGAAHCQFTLSTAQIWNAAVATFKASASSITYGLAESDGVGQNVASDAVFDTGESDGAGQGMAQPAVFATGASAGNSQATASDTLFANGVSAGAGQSLATGTLFVSGQSAGAGQSNVASTWLWALAESDGVGQAAAVVVIQAQIGAVILTDGALFVVSLIDALLPGSLALSDLALAVVQLTDALGEAM